MDFSQEKKYTGDERRKFPRLNTDMDVEYTIVATDSPRHRYRTKNISAGGICLIMDEQIGIGSYLYLTMYIPDSKEPITALGRVVWQEKTSPISSDERTRYDIGIEFINIENSERERISKYIVTFKISEK